MIISILFHWLYSPLGPWPLIFSFMIILQTVGLLGRVISSSKGLYLNTGQHKHMNQASERAKTVHALDSSANVTGHNYHCRITFSNNSFCNEANYSSRITLGPRKWLLF
jgi:hypothetical protein